MSEEGGQEVFRSSVVKRAERPGFETEIEGPDFFRHRSGQRYSTRTLEILSFKAELMFGEEASKRPSQF